MVVETGIPEPLFAVPRVTADADEDGALVIRSAEPLAGYPVTIMHSVRARPPGLDAGEITDKGYVNQRQVLANRAALVDLLYAEPAPETPENPELPTGVVEAERTA